MNNSIFFSKRQSLYENLLIISLFFAPYTLLRIGRIGASEVAIIIFVIFVITGETLANRFEIVGNYVFSKFWLLYLFLSSFGFGYNYFFLGHKSGTIESMMFDLASYLLIFATCFVLESLFISEQRRIDVWKILNRVYLFSSIALPLLFLIGRLTGSSRIFYSEIFFSPFSMNIHHVSMFLVPLPFIGLKIFKETKTIKTRLFIFITIISNVMLGLATGSSKVILSFLLSFLIFLIYLPLRIRGFKQNRYLFASFVLLSLAVGLIFSGTHLKEMAFSLFYEHDLDSARYYLYKSALIKSLDSPLVGYGPGAHAEISDGVFMDTHQTFFTALLQSGLLGMILYLFLSLKVFQRCSKDIYLLGAYSSILIYSLGGDTLRRLPMWLFMVMFYYLSDFKKASTARKSSS